MRFKIDENLPVEVARLLREAGHEAATVRDQAMTGATDARLVSICREEDRLLMTLDTDFADIRAYPPGMAPGLVVLRLKRQDKPYVLDVVRRLLPIFETEPLARKLGVVDERHIRIRA